MRVLAQRGQLGIALVVFGASVGVWSLFMAGFAQAQAGGLPAVFLSIDEDTIDNGTNCSDVDRVPVDEGGTCSSIEECAFFSCPGAAAAPIDNQPSFLVNDEEASIPGDGGNCPNILRINTLSPPAVVITLPTGEVGDEGLFSPAPGAFDGLPGELPGYINCDPAQDENFLDGIAGAPLTAADIFALEGRIVCAVVHDSDISDLGSGELSLKGSRKGRTAFEVIKVTSHPAALEGGKELPVLEVEFLDAADVDAACGEEIPCGDHKCVFDGQLLINPQIGQLDLSFSGAIDLLGRSQGVAERYTRSRCSGP